MGKTRTITPIEDCSSDRVQFGFQTPSIIRDGGLGIDLEAMESICELGGIRRLVIEWADKTEAPNIGGVFPGGVATMAPAIATRKVKSDSELANKDVAKTCRRIGINIGLNKQALLDDLTDTTAEGLARTLDREIREEIAKRGLEFLLQPGGTEATTHTIILLLAFFQSLFLLLGGGDPRNPLYWWEGGLIPFAGYYLIINPIVQKKLMGGRYSIINLFGTEPIQALRLLFRLAHSQLIYSIPQEENQSSAH